MKPDPDYTRLIKAIHRTGDPDNIRFLELFADPEFIAGYLGEETPITFDQVADHELWKRSVDQKIRFWYSLGYDAIWERPAHNFPHLAILEAEDTALLSRKTRDWINEKKGRITTWAEFESYPWPNNGEVDYFPIEFMSKQLPDGMGILGGINGVFETLSFLMGYETLCLSLYDQADLVAAICERILHVLLPIARSLAQMDRVIGLWMGDDLGFRTGTLISTRHLRQYIFPLQHQIAAIAHEYGKPFLLHSCGNLKSIMGDLISFVGVDAKHSFEDAIEPVEHFCEIYRDRVCTIGGIDIDLLARGSEEQVRLRTRRLLESCSPSKAYVLGSGNSITNYVPVANFLAMLDEGNRFNRVS